MSSLLLQKETKQEIFNYKLKKSIPIWEAHQWCVCPYCNHKFDILETNRDAGIFPHQVGAFCLRTDFTKRTEEDVDSEGNELPKFELQACPHCKETIKIELTEYYYGEGIDSNMIKTKINRMKRFFKDIFPKNRNNKCQKD